MDFICGVFWWVHVAREFQLVLVCVSVCFVGCQRTERDMIGLCWDPFYFFDLVGLMEWKDLFKRNSLFSFICPSSLSATISALDWSLFTMGQFWVILLFIWSFPFWEWFSCILVIFLSNGQWFFSPFFGSNLLIRTNWKICSFHGKHIPPLISLLEMKFLCPL